MATWSGVIVPVPEADPVVGEWLRWDPAAWLGVPAHVTLLAPFVRPPAPAETVDRLATLLGGTAPWRARFSALAEFPGGVLYLAPDDPAPFVALTAALAAAWPEHPPYGGAFDTVVPHLTVCEGAPPATRAAAAAAVGPALPLTTEVHEAWLMEQPEPGAPYALRARLPFG
jgi:hypothetical protein